MSDNSGTGLPLSDAESRFVTIYESHVRSVYVYCRRRVAADRVDDVVADVFLTVWKKIDLLPTGDSALPWIYGIAYRVVLHQWRGASRQRRLSQRLGQLGHAGVALPEEHILQSYESQQVLEATSRLKRTDQEILRLSMWEELSHAETATVLGLSPEAVRQRLSRALKSLTQEFNRLEKRTGHTPAAQEGGA